MAVGRCAPSFYPRVCDTAEMNLFWKLLEQLAKIHWSAWLVAFLLSIAIYGSQQPGCCAGGIDSGEAPAYRWSD